MMTFNDNEVNFFSFIHNKHMCMIKILIICNVTTTTFSIAFSMSNGHEWKLFYLKYGAGGPSNKRSNWIDLT